MKKLFVILVIILISNKGFPQNYLPLSIDSSVYRVDYPVYHLGICWGMAASYQYEFTGDTLINTNSYKKVNKKGSIFDNSCYEGTPLGYQGGLRQDTIQKKIFIVKPGNLTEELLYDFNLNAGDTIQSAITSSGGCNNVIISSIDSTQINGVYLKRWNSRWIEYCDTLSAETPVLIEGIGSPYGLLDYYIAFEGGPWLICLSRNGFILYPDSSASCPIILSTKEINRYPCEFEIRDENNLLEITNNNLSKCDYDHMAIYDTAGRKIYSGSGSASHHINKNIISKGLVLLTFMKSNNTVYSYKYFNR